MIDALPAGAAPVYGYKPLTWEIVDEQMGYGYLAS